MYNGPDGCAGYGSRQAAFPDLLSTTHAWDVSIFPNPAQNQLNISGNAKKEILEISIRDLSGRLILTKRVETKEFIAKLDLSLMNGVYLITIRNPAHEQVTKRLLIAK